MLKLLLELAKVAGCHNERSHVALIAVVLLQLLLLLLFACCCCCCCCADASVAIAAAVVVVLLLFLLLLLLVLLLLRIPFTGRPLNLPEAVEYDNFLIRLFENYT